ncbi:hypothetical protein AWZ03_011151 [Drosophila navojoa]|uniref:Prolyl 4-hydroxylase alpha subunit domain-containing protein n=1 Tax=Drosophila navojoa TaxID=7232 RepID=A0A484B2X9_DRONA|nr:hypothetical protein AWZ03_011151 [Drosophila navojoa]
MRVIKIMHCLIQIYFSCTAAAALENLVKQKSHASSTEVVKDLLDVEEMLEDNLHEYVKELKSKLDLTQQALVKFRDEANSMSNDFEAYLSNPLSSFALIRHQQQDWHKWALFMEQRIGGEYIAFAHHMRTRLPTAVDLTEALRSIETLIKFYQLHPKDLANGILLNHSQPDSALNSLDCYALGMFNYRKREYSKAEVWFNISLTLYDKRNEDKYTVYDFSKKQIHKWLGVLLVRRREHSLGVWHLNQAEDILEYDDELISLAILREHCSARFHRPTHLHCRYNNWMTPFLRIAPLKLEELSLDPLIVLYHEAIYNSEIEALLKGQEPNLDSGKDNLDQTILERVADMSGLNLDRSEELSAINYDIGGHFQLQEVAPETAERPQNLIATVLFYLEDVELVGATIFPRLNLTIKPEKGSALLWHLLPSCGSSHPKALHAACPVISSSKYGNSRKFSIIS